MSKLEQHLHLTKDADINMVYEAIHSYVQKELNAIEPIQQKRKVYYVSAEFLMGKMLINHLINLHLYDEVEKLVSDRGFTMQELAEVEAEPSLGNGGLGRLAACYLDGAAALGYACDGIGLRYHFGLFKQVFEHYKQKELIDPWLDGKHWVRKTEMTYPVYFGNMGVLARMYEMDIPGVHGGKNTLRLFDIESVDESMVQEGSISFDQRDIERNLTLFLYPDDSTEEGRLLRIYQQYFMVSCGAQYILEAYKAQGYELKALAEHVMIQINDTHPTLIIPELVRLLMREGFVMKEAIQIVSKTCAYTNHTILAEALETWPRSYLKKVVPQLMDIIEAMDAISAYQGHNKQTQIIDHEDRVHMAHLDIHYGCSINGVASLHTEILKHTELKEFYALYPNKFHNVTNGISFRRFLYGCNRELTKLIETAIGDSFYDHPEDLKELMKYVDDEAFLTKLLNIKSQRKELFAQDIKQTQGITILPDAIYDVQIKRLHEYKRQQMNALYIIHKYLQIKQGILPKRPITFFFGAKAAPAYVIAKDIIHLLLVLQEVIAQDPVVSKHMQLCFIENYNVSKAELLIPAADLSEQISLASKEASGTGNMKLMANGAITIGTLDGANVEIAEAVGSDAIYLFGETSEQVIAHYEKQDYVAKAYYEQDEVIKQAVDFIISDEVLQLGDEISLKRLYMELINKDWFMTLLDVKDYIACKDQALIDYEDRMNWAKKMLINIANCGFFCADRAVKEYGDHIWKL